MKKWISPEIEELELKYTATLGVTDELSGEGDENVPQGELGTCHNPYWEGNGMTLEEAQQNNPFWSGSWGN